MTVRAVNRCEQMLAPSETVLAPSAMILVPSAMVLLPVQQIGHLKIFLSMIKNFRELAKGFLGNHFAPGVKSFAPSQKQYLFKISQNLRQRQAEVATSSETQQQEMAFGLKDKF